MFPGTELPPTAGMGESRVLVKCHQAIQGSDCTWYWGHPERVGFIFPMADCHMGGGKRFVKRIFDLA